LLTLQKFALDTKASREQKHGAAHVNNETSHVAKHTGKKAGG